MDQIEGDLHILKVLVKRLEWSYESKSKSVCRRKPKLRVDHFDRVMLLEALFIKIFDFEESVKELNAGLCEKEFNKLLAHGKDLLAAINAI